MHPLSFSFLEVFTLLPLLPVQDRWILNPSVMCKMFLALFRRAVPPWLVFVCLPSAINSSSLIFLNVTCLSSPPFCLAEHLDGQTVAGRVRLIDKRWEGVPEPFISAGSRGGTRGNQVLVVFPVGLFIRHLEEPLRLSLLPWCLKKDQVR